MPNFDQYFETTRLTMIAKQNPEIMKAAGEVIFCAEDYGDRLWCFLPVPFDEYWSSNLKIMLVGRETSGW